MLYKTEQYGNRFVAEVLPDGCWHGHPAFIVGGGPSLEGFDFSRLRGLRTIAVNIAFYNFEPTVIFSMDTRCHRWITGGAYEQRLPGLRSKFERTAAYKVWLLTYKATLPGDVFIVPVFQDYTSGLSAFRPKSDEGIGHGNNSGYGALNFAVCLGADPIYLLGIDCRHSPDGKTHYHGGHPIPQPVHHVNGFAKYFEAAAARIAAIGTRVINLSPTSALTCFEKRPPEEVL